MDRSLKINCGFTRAEDIIGIRDIMKNWGKELRDGVGEAWPNLPGRLAKKTGCKLRLMDIHVTGKAGESGIL
ncbi:hypothetical protein ES703_109942 [subsurface metagenome]